MSFVAILVLSWFRFSVLSHFNFLRFVTISSLFEFRNFGTILVFKLCHNFIFCHNLSFIATWVFEFSLNLGLVTILFLDVTFLVFEFGTIWVFELSQFRFLSFVTIWVFELSPEDFFWFGHKFFFNIFFSPKKMWVGEFFSNWKIMFSQKKLFKER